MRQIQEGEMCGRKNLFIAAGWIGESVTRQMEDGTKDDIML